MKANLAEVLRLPDRQDYVWRYAQARIATPNARE
jgi:hypothetical protein